MEKTTNNGKRKIKIGIFCFLVARFGFLFFDFCSGPAVYVDLWCAAIMITGPVHQYVGYASLVHCNCKFCAAICCIWAFVITGSVQQYAGRVQFKGRPCPETCQKNVCLCGSLVCRLKTNTDTPTRIYKLAGWFEY